MPLGIRILTLVSIPCWSVHKMTSCTAAIHMKLNTGVWGWPSGGTSARFCTHTALFVRKYATYSHGGEPHSCLGACNRNHHLYPHTGFRIPPMASPTDMSARPPCILGYGLLQQHPVDRAVAVPDVRLQQQRSTNTLNNSGRSKCLGKLQVCLDQITNPAAGMVGQSR